MFFSARIGVLKSPKVITLSPQEVEVIKASVDEAPNISKKHKAFLKGSIDAYFWIFDRLQEATLSIHRLRSVFGIKSEKKVTQDKNSPSSSKNKKPKKKKGHGRTKSEDYTAAKNIECK